MFKETARFRVAGVSDENFEFNVSPMLYLSIRSKVVRVQRFLDKYTIKNSLSYEEVPYSQSQKKFTHTLYKLIQLLSRESIMTP